MKQNKKRSKLNLVFISFITIISAMGGLLFGYDWVVIGGAKPFYESYFSISDNPGMQGWAMSSAIVGCLFGALSAGAVSDRFGRKLPLILAAAIFTVSAIGTGFANSLSIFIVYRIIGGFGIGMASVLSPIYIAEIAPAHLRGRFVSINQLTIVIGILLAQIINYLIAQEVPEEFTNQQILNSWNGQMGWRWMFWAENVFSVSFFILVLFIPESPRWLIKAGEKEKASNTLSRIGGIEYAETRSREIEDTIYGDSRKIDFKTLFSKRMRKIIMIGAVLAILQQLCGINVIFNYAQEIFTAAGYGVSEMLFNVVITGTVNLIFTLLAIKVMDKWGRRLLMLLGYGGLTIVFTLFGWFFWLKLTGIIMLVSVLIGLSLYSLTLAPTTWVVLSEIFPNRIRGVAMSIATFALWTACFVLTYSFPIINDTLGASGTFWVYAAICAFGLFFVYRNIIETKGKTLEEIEKIM
jgi:sugar porter (SP) family MFS transporter